MVMATDVNNCENMAMASVTVNALPTILVNSESICAGNSATLTASGATTYTWSTTDNNSSIVVTPILSVSQFTVMATDANNCENMALASVTVNALPTILVNSESICAGNSATLTASGASTYTWSSSDNNSSIVVTPTGSVNQYTVIATDANNCENSSVASVTVNALPIVTISTASVNLQCETINSVTLDGGTPLNGAYSGIGVVAGVFSPSAVGVGTYTITYAFTDGNNCSNSAYDFITVDACTGIQNFKTESFTIYPNPANDAVFINSLLFPANVNVFDVNGKLVISQDITAFENEINLSNCVNGIYQLNITIGQKSFNYKIMINK
jgi:RES domain-containing protein